MYGIKQTSKWKVVTLTKLQQTARPPMLLTSFVKKLVRAWRSNPRDLSSRDTGQTQPNLHILCCIWCSSPVATSAFVLETHELVILLSVCLLSSQSTCFSCPFLFRTSSHPSQTAVFTFCFDIWAVFLRPVSICSFLMIHPSIYPAAATILCYLQNPISLVPRHGVETNNSPRMFQVLSARLELLRQPTSWAEEQLGSWPLHWAEKPSWTTLP